jgi:ribosomal protein S18 acetylase RimI-like enzyme
VWPNESSGQDALEEKLHTVDDFYARWGTRARYQMCPAAQPDDLDHILDQRGYTLAAQTAVQVTSAATVMRQAGTTPASIRNRECTGVRIGTLNDTWFTTYALAAQMTAHERAMRRGILERIAPRTGFAIAHIDDRPVAVGLGVVERGWTGIFCMETLPDFRRKGAATAILTALAQWSQTHGAAQMYLQVMHNNAPALGLYKRAGFEPLYSYHYREAPLSGPGM